MRKKKTPYVLMAALLVLVGVAAVVNMAQLDLLPKPSGPSEVRTVSEDGHDHSDIKDDMRASMTQGARSEQEARGGKPDGSTNPEKPTVAVEKPVKYKPSPSSMQTSGQWYREESGAKKMPK